jgi:hypothetical protein
MRSLVALASEFVWFNTPKRVWWSSSRLGEPLRRRFVHRPSTCGECNEGAESSNHFAEGKTMNANAKTAAMIFGVLFVIVGVLGFIPNPIISPTGFFVVNEYHNLFHIGAGIVLLMGAYASAGSFGPGMALRFVGSVFAIVAVMGFFLPGSVIFSAVPMNMADHWLHTLLAVVLLLAGFALAPAPRSATA